MAVKVRNKINLLRDIHVIYPFELFRCMCGVFQNANVMFREPSGHVIR